jgi:hypothetical protein
MINWKNLGVFLKKCSNEKNIKGALSLIDEGIALPSKAVRKFGSCDMGIGLLRPFRG